MAFRIQFGLRTLLLLTAVLAVVFSLAAWVYRNWDEYEVANLHCGDGRSIRITADTWWDENQGYYYSVVSNGKIVIPKTYFFAQFVDGHEERLRFRLVQAEKGNLVGVIMEPSSSDQALVIIHDFATGDSWPRSFYDTDLSYLSSFIRKWQGYLDRLQRENPRLVRPRDLDESKLLGE